MLKWLAIIGVLFAFAVGSASARQETSPQEQQKKPHDNSADTITVYNDDNSTHEREQRSDRPQGVYKFITWPESWEVWALIVTLGAIIWQATLMRRHAKHFRDLAEATNKQAGHLVTSERAWIIVSSRFPDGHHPVEQGPVTRFRWEFKNVGKSPARLLEFNGVAQRADRWNVSFADPPRFVNQAEPLNKLLLVPTDSWGLLWMVEGDALSVEEFASLRDFGETTLISYGYVKYLDAFGEEHTTRFCQEFWFDKRSKEGHFMPRIKVPASYTDCD